MRDAHARLGGSFLLFMLVACGGSPAAPDAASGDAPTLDAPVHDAGVDAAEPFGLLVETEALDFGDVCVGLSGEPVELSIANPSGTATPPIRASVTGDDATAFAIASSTCEAGVAPRGFCSLQITLSPVMSGLVRASLELEVDDRSFIVALAGRGLDCDGLTLRPASYDFGDVAIGETSAPATFTVTNSGGGESGVLTASIGGVDASDFALAPGVSDGCSRRALRPGASCTIDVVFSPTRAGASAASLDVEEPFLGVPSASLVGTGAPAAPGLSFRPAELDFGSTCASSADLVLTNDGTGPTGPITLAVSGPDASSFGIVASSCTDGLAPGASCMVTVRAEPVAPGTRSAELVATFAGGESRAALTATGITDCGGFLVIEPATRAFGALAVGEVGAPSTFTVRNAGGGMTAPLVVALAGMDPAQFELSADACTGAMLAAGGSCTFDVRFVPVARGSFGAAARAVAVPGGTATASLTGIGE